MAFKQSTTHVSQNETLGIRLKGGKARAKKLTAEQRKVIAQQAAQARWAKEK